MKILLVGGQAALAQALHPVLTNFAEVVTAGRSACDLALDLTWSADRFELPPGLDAVIHLAAHFGGTGFDSMLAAEETNALGALKLAHACACAGVGHLLQVSSLSAALDDASPYFGAYALSKGHGEELASWYCRQAGLPLAILRPAQIYGDDDGFRRHQPLLYTIMDRAQRGEDIVLYGTHDARRNYVHAEDVAHVIAAMLRQRVEGRYDCLAASDLRLSEIAATAIAAFASNSMVRFDPGEADIVDNVFAPNDALYRLIDYFPRISLAQGLARQATRRKAQS